MPFSPDPMNNPTVFLPAGLAAAAGLVAFLFCPLAGATVVAAAGLAAIASEVR